MRQVAGHIGFWWCVVSAVGAGVVIFATADSAPIKIGAGAVYAWIVAVYMHEANANKRTTTVASAQVTAEREKAKAFTS
jgi:hypothetical protein